MRQTSDQGSVKACDWIATFLAEKKVPAVYNLSGGMTTFMIDAIAQLGQTQIVNTRHEQAAGFAAEAATRIIGIPAVAMATSGPGATNLITAIGSCYFDSTPVVFITGQVNRSEIKLDKNQRQNGFQELDIVEMVKGITKYAVRIDDAAHIAEIFTKAWLVATSGRPGPVLIDIPIDVQQVSILQSTSTDLAHPTVVMTQPDANFDFLIEKLLAADRPLILAGGGIRIAGEVPHFRELVEKLAIPVVTSLMGVDALGNDSKYKVGMIGSYGNRWANRALAKSDFLLVLGSRLDVRQTGGSIEDFVKEKNIFRVDIDVFEINGRVKVKTNFDGGLAYFFERLLKTDLQINSEKFLTQIKEDQKSFPQASEQSINEGINPSVLMHEISRIFSKSNGYLVDVGQHQMWAAQSIELKDDQRFITSGGMGAMGFSIPASIGAATSKSGRWIVISGDGCTQLSIAELQTIKDLDLNVVICVLNNRQHGMVAQFQEANLGSRFIATRDGYSTPAFVDVAKAFGIPAYFFTSLEELCELEFDLTNAQGPLLLEFQIPQDAKALPKMDYKTSILDL
jgi:acetolactate synthase-1/2/3 large subunit